MTTKPQPSRCERCGKAMASVPPLDDAALREYQAVFPGYSIEEAVVVCEECWDEVMEERPDLLARLQEHAGT